ncbi:MAG TPA: glycosyltransferase 61 family protein [Aeromicrobium sp.]|nr:glycosyltransferase 61 family protein [Aeromicrobium sp.]
MSRLPRRLQPAWPLAKRAHLAATVMLGVVWRRLAPLWGPRGLPRRASLQSADTASVPSEGAVLHAGPAGEVIDRASAQGEPPLHPTFEAARAAHLPDPYVLELSNGTVVGDYGATVTARGTFDFETSRYFSVYRWNEHPLFLRPRLPKPYRVDGTVASLATRGGDRNYYHFLLEVLPRWALVRQLVADAEIDAVFMPAALGYERDLAAMAGIDADKILPTGSVPAVQASRLLIPSYPNMGELQPRWLVEWVRATFQAVNTEELPRRLFVTRANTRRLIQGPAIEAMLRERGFVTIDPGTMSAQEQIDHFSAAEVIVGIHGAAMTNLVFAPVGVRVLELFAPRYVKHCYWALSNGIPDARYRYLIGRGRPPRPGQPMYGLQDDIDVDPDQVRRELDVLLDR